MSFGFDNRKQISIRPDQKIFYDFFGELNEDRFELIKKIMNSLVQGVRCKDQGPRTKNQGLLRQIRMDQARKADLRGPEPSAARLGPLVPGWWMA